MGSVSVAQLGTGSGPVRCSIRMDLRIHQLLTIFHLSFLLLHLAREADTQSPSACNCFDCKTVIEGPYAGNYYAMGTSSGGCLYRERDNGKIIRACDTENDNSQQYHICFDKGGLTVCRDPPEAADFGYDTRLWDGNKELQTSSVRYVCPAPKKVVGYNGSENYDIWCSAAEFPNWQFSLPGNQLPLCQLP